MVTAGPVSIHSPPDVTDGLFEFISREINPDDPYNQILDTPWPREYTRPWPFATAPSPVHDLPEGQEVEDLLGQLTQGRRMLLCNCYDLISSFI